MYGKCGSLEEAFRIFAAMSNRNVVSWGAMITAYSQHGKGNLALDCFRQMQEVFIIEPNEVIFSSILKSCASIGELEHGRIIHESMMDSCFQADVVVANSLIDMYAKCGNLLDAFYVFDKMLNRDVVSWNTMITGCAQHDESILALEFFDEMQSEGVKPERTTFCIVLKACGNIGAIEQGKFIHGLIVNNEGQFDVAIANALVDMYARCGNLERAKWTFDQFPVQDVRLWNAMIAAYAQHGETLVAQKYFQAMQMNAIPPNDMSFTNILVACGRTGLVDAGLWYFKFIREHHNIAATDIHFATVTDILGRAGHLSEAEDLLEASIGPNIIAWKSLLNACKLHGNVEIGRHCFDQLVCLDQQCDAGYVLMSNVYADCEDA